MHSVKPFSGNTKGVKYWVNKHEGKNANSFSDIAFWVNVQGTLVCNNIWFNFSVFMEKHNQVQSRGTVIAWMHGTYRCMNEYTITCIFTSMEHTCISTVTRRVSSPPGDLVWKENNETTMELVTCTTDCALWCLVPCSTLSAWNLLKNTVLSRVKDALETHPKFWVNKLRVFNYSCVRRTLSLAFIFIFKIHKLDSKSLKFRIIITVSK